MGAAVSSLGALGCGGSPVDATPSSAARAFVESAQRDDARGREEVYRLMCPEAQVALAELARGSAALGSRGFEPWEMLAEGRVVVLNPPRRASAYHERSGDGEADRRIVDVFDEGGAAHPLTLLRVEGSWCVSVEIPPPERG